MSERPYIHTINISPNNAHNDLSPTQSPHRVGQGQDESHIMRYYWMAIIALLMLLGIQYVYTTTQRSHNYYALTNSQQIQSQQRAQLLQLQRDAAIRDKQLLMSQSELQSVESKLDTYKSLVEQLKLNSEREFIHAVRIMNSSTHNLNATSIDQFINLLIDDSPDDYKSAKVENVIRLNGDGKYSDNTIDDYVDSSNKLVDSSDNVYVLSSSADNSRQTIDTRLVFDLGSIIVTSCIFGYIVLLMGQPVIIGKCKV